MDIIFNKVNLPDEIKSMIDEYLGGTKYWDAREQLTVYNRKIDIFSSDWWKDWHSYLNWHHWYVNQNDNNYTSRDMNDLVDVVKLPSRFSWLFVEEDKEVALLLKLYKASVDNKKLLYILNMKLDIMYNYWKSHVEYYKKIVFEK
jgi:hypothetical protein